MRAYISVPHKSMRAIYLSGQNFDTTSAEARSDVPTTVNSTTFTTFNSTIFFCAMIK